MPLPPPVRYFTHAYAAHVAALEAQTAFCKEVGPSLLTSLLCVQCGRLLCCSYLQVIAHQCREESQLHQTWR